MKDWKKEIKNARNTDHLSEIVDAMLKSVGELENSQGDDTYYDTAERIRSEKPEIADLMMLAENEFFILV